MFSILLPCGLHHFLKCGALHNGKVSHLATDARNRIIFRLLEQVLPLFGNFREERLISVHISALEEHAQAMTGSRGRPSEQMLEGGLCPDWELQESIFEGGIQNSEQSFGVAPAASVLACGQTSRYEMKILIPIRFRLQWNVVGIWVDVLRKVHEIDAGAQAGGWVDGRRLCGDVKLVAEKLSLREGGVDGEEVGIAKFDSGERERCHHGRRRCRGGS